MDNELKTALLAGAGIMAIMLVTGLCAGLIALGLTLLARSLGL